MSTDDRRAPGATRIPFEALVEVGGELGPPFEAQAIDVSEDGMHLRTAYLPEVGQPLSCRFDAGPAGSVIATGSVVWKQEAGKGGEFGIRFADLDPQSATALKQMMGVENAPPPAKGNRIRLHIEGLGSPMRAHVKDSARGRLTAFSGLGFLQVGKHLELEDASTGNKRPARVVRVECEIEPESRVPQLVMSFQYEDEETEEPAKESTPEPMVTQEELPPTAQASSDDEDDLSDRASEMKGFVARTASKVTPAFQRLLERAKTTAALLAAKRKGQGDDVAIPLRRRTAPAPQGGLHASGRKVVREALANDKEILADGLLRSKNTKRIAIGATAAGALLLGAIALHKPSAPPADAAGVTDTAGQVAAAPLTPTTAESPLTPPPSVLSPVTPTMPVAPNGALAANSGATEVPANDVFDEGNDSRPHRHPRVAPFSNGSVSHGNVLKLKMDGDIEKIEGDGQPTGFTVVLPGRKSLEPAAPLAARDSRIASIRVTNDGSGAELTVAFKDGVPNYLVRAKGDVLEIVLAPTGSVGDANKTVRVLAAPARHHRRHHEKH